MKSYEVRFRQQAQRDLIALDLYLSARFGGDATEQFMHRLEAACLSLCTAQRRGRAVLGSNSGLRVMGFERRVASLFQIRDDAVEILRVLYRGKRA